MRKAISAVVLVLVTACVAARAQEAITVRVDPSILGPRLTGTSSASLPNISAMADLWRNLGRPLPRSPTPAASATMWRRSSHSSSQRALAGRLLRRRVSLARRRREARNAAVPQLQLGRCARHRTAFGTDEYYRIHRSDRRRSLCFGQCRLRHRRGSGRRPNTVADQATTLAKERARNGRPAPYKVALLGLGNESLGMRL